MRLLRRSVAAIAIATTAVLACSTNNDGSSSGSSGSTDDGSAPPTTLDGSVNPPLDGGGSPDGNDQTDVGCGGLHSPPCADGLHCKVASDCTSDVCKGGSCQVPSCTDTVKNGAETDVDCGGTCSTKCADSKGCAVPADCTSNICQGNICRPATCTDKIKNGNETDVDCGGSCSPCADLSACKVAGDCTSAVCTGNVCQVPTCSDNVKNGAETDKDCGGGTCPACASLLKCKIAGDCASGVCTGGVCQAPACNDNVKNGAETDKDCGGGVCAACADGLACVAGARDCQSLVCTGNVCQVPACNDGVKNGTETDKDCGGGCTACADLLTCKVAADCQSGVCTGGVCQVPTCNDNVTNGAETGKDCGGGVCAKCADGGGCVTGARDCTSLVCTGGVCQVPACNDGVKNGTETDKDCGGGACPGCADDLVCNGGADCKSSFCSTAKICVAGQSCITAAASGVNSCGKRESNDPTHVWENCCRSLPLPNLPARLDKYEVTAGRFRQFIGAVGPDIRTWAANQIAANTPAGQRLAADIPAAQRGLLPASANDGDPLNLHVQIGMTVMDSRVPSAQQGCFNDGLLAAYGANTYYWDVATLRGYFGAGFPARRYTQAQYDEKPMNCGTYWIYAAFCAWDGGRMPTQAEINDAWGPTIYPYNVNVFPFPLSPAGPYAWEQTVNYYNNRAGGQFYNFPGAPDGADEAGEIGAPGRFILDATFRKSPVNNESWMDLGANVMEMVHTAATGGNTFCDWSVFAPGDVASASCVDATNHPGQNGVLRASNLPNVPWYGGSWEGHRAFSTAEPVGGFFANPSYNISISAQYGKAGLRCAR